MSSKSTKKQQAQTTKNTASLAKAATIDLSKALNAGTSFGVQIQATLSKINEELIQKHSELQVVDEAIALKKQEMEALHGVDQTLLTLDEAKAQHATELEKMAAEREELKVQYEDLKKQLETTRQRENEVFTYDLAQKRKNELDAWNEQVRLRTNAERDRQEAFEKDLTARMETLVAQETSYKDAFAKAASFESELKKEVDKQVAIVSNVLKKDFGHQTEIANITNTSTVAGLNGTIAQLTKTVAEREGTIKKLEDQLQVAIAAQVTLASKTVDGAANKAAQADALALVTNIGTNNGAQRPRS